MDNFNLENQYQIYLKRVALNENKMHPTQKKQLKQTFMGACGQMLLLFRDELGALEEEKAIEIMQGMINQVSDYFLKATHKTN
jgi:hypothetical protein